MDSEKYKWHKRVDPLFDIYAAMAKQIQVEVDDAIIQACIDGGGFTLANMNSVKDGSK